MRVCVKGSVCVCLPDESEQSEWDELSPALVEVMGRRQIVTRD